MLSDVPWNLEQIWSSPTTTQKEKRKKQQQHDDEKRITIKIKHTHNKKKENQKSKTKWKHTRHIAAGRKAKALLPPSDPPPILLRYPIRQSGVVGQSAGLLGVRKHPFDCDKPWTFLPYSTLYALCLEALNKQWPWPITATTRKKQKTRTYNTHQKERKKENQKSKSKHTRHIQPELVGKSRSSSLPPILLRFSDSTKQRGGTICLGN